MSKPVLSSLVIASLAFGADRVTATGKVVDTVGNPVEHAAVLVYSAGVKKGYSLYCPTCYVDCGKRTFTAADGTYRIPGLSADLQFNLLVAGDGYSTTLVRKVDPEKGSAETATLKKRVAFEDQSHLIRGKVVDREGEPVRDALVEQQGAIFAGNGGRRFGSPGWLDPIAVSNDKGEFEMAYEKPLDSAIVQISPRGMASKLATLPAGAERKTVIVTDGATIRGRLIQSNGKPVAHVEMGLATHTNLSGAALAEVRIGTDDEGRFAFTNVPAGRVWYLYGKADTLAPLGLAADVVECATKDDGQEVDAGDIAVKPGYTLRGKVVLSDGKPIASGMRVMLGGDRVQDSQTVMLGPDGEFEFRGLGRGVYTLYPAVKGYEPREPLRMELLIEGNTGSLTALMDPAVPGRW